jgi:ribosomal protein S18 acetylase RimI-like enzyme
MSKIMIEPLRSSEVDEASVLLSRAFSPTPLPRVVFGDPSEELRHIMVAAMKNMIGNMPGKVFLAKENGQIIGVMRIVEWPDCQKPPSAQVFNLIPEEIALRFGKWRSTWAKHDPKKPHWHLDPIGVLPERQGQGIGSLLLEHFCEYVDKLKQAAYLETDQTKNVRFYSRFGFTIVGEIPILNVPNWFMWRPPQSE